MKARAALAAVVGVALAATLTAGGVAAAGLADGQTSCPATVTDDATTTTITTTCTVEKPAPVTETATTTATATERITERVTSTVRTTATVTVTATPQPEPTALLGGSYGAADESRYNGRAEAARVFFAGGLPADVTSSAFDQAYADGVRTFVISWKGTQTGAQVASALGSLPDDVTVYGSYWHEPEDNIGSTITLAQWRSRSVEQNAAMESVGVIPTTILMQWTLAPASGRDYMDYANVGAKVAAWDFYMNPAKGKDDPEAAVDRMLAASLQMGAESTGIAETGVPSSVPEATRVDLVKRLRAKILATPEVEWGTFWSSGDFAFTDATADAWFA